MRNHYKWLESNLENIFKSLGLNMSGYEGIIVSHGDKCYSSKSLFEENGIPFEHGVVMYLLTHVKPFSSESRSTENGWVDPFSWIIKNYSRFKQHFPVVV